jgi:hypothetical protein
MNGERFELEQLDEEDPFEIDSQAATCSSIRIWGGRYRRCLG